MFQPGRFDAASAETVEPRWKSGQSVRLSNQGLACVFTVNKRPFRRIFMANLEAWFNV